MTGAAAIGQPVLVDTDVFSYLFSRTGRHQDFVPMLRGRLLCMSFACYGEALSLGHSRGWGGGRMGDLRRALSQYVVLPYDAEVAERWAPLHVKLRGQLHSGGANDLWTVACALAQPGTLPIATNNLKDFQAIARYAEIQLLHPDLQ